AAKAARLLTHVSNLRRVGASTQAMPFLERFTILCDERLHLAQRAMKRAGKDVGAPDPVACELEPALETLEHAPTWLVSVSALDTRLACVMLRHPIMDGDTGGFGFV